MCINNTRVNAIAKRATCTAHILIYQIPYQQLVTTYHIMHCQSNGFTRFGFLGGKWYRTSRSFSLCFICSSSCAEVVM